MHPGFSRNMIIFFKKLIVFSPDDAVKFTSEMHDPCTQESPTHKKKIRNTLQKAPVWSRPNTLQRLSQKSSYNSRVLERGQLCVPLCEEDVGAFIVVRSCLFSLQPKSFPCRASLILVGQVFSLQDKSCPCSPSPFLAEQVFRNLKRGG